MAVTAKVARGAARKPGGALRRHAEVNMDLLASEQRVSCRVHC